MIIEARALARTFRTRTGVVEAVRGVDFQIAEGEIVGLAGLQGSGNTELLNGIFGAYGALSSGQVWIDQQPLAGRPRPGASIRRGLSLLTNDRKASGIIPEASVADNITMAAIARMVTAAAMPSTPTPDRVS